MAMLPAALEATMTSQNRRLVFTPVPKSDAHSALVVVFFAGTFAVVLR